jgi:hypothetical protein
MGYLPLPHLLDELVEVIVEQNVPWVYAISLVILALVDGAVPPLPVLAVLLQQVLHVVLELLRLVLGDSRRLVSKVGVDYLLVHVADGLRPGEFI